MASDEVGFLEAESAGAQVRLRQSLGAAQRDLKIIANPAKWVAERPWTTLGAVGGAGIATGYLVTRAMRQHVARSHCESRPAAPRVSPRQAGQNEKHEPRRGGFWALLGTILLNAFKLAPAAARLITNAGSGPHAGTPLAENHNDRRSFLEETDPQMR